MNMLTVSENGTLLKLPSPQFFFFYLVHISVRAASYPLDQLEILLRIPPGQVDTGVHCFQSRTVDEPRRTLKTGSLRKAYGVKNPSPNPL